MQMNLVFLAVLFFVTGQQTPLRGRSRFLFCTHCSTTMTLLKWHADWYNYHVFSFLFLLVREIKFLNSSNCWNRLNEMSRRLVYHICVSTTEAASLLNYPWKQPWKLHWLPAELVKNSGDKASLKRLGLRTLERTNNNHELSRIKADQHKLNFTPHCCN